MTLRYRELRGDRLRAALDDLARLRIAVFRAWPYLYDGDMDHERGYMRNYADNDRAILVAALDGERIVGASTGTPMEDHADGLRAPFEATGISPTDVFYCAESVLLPAWRGQGAGHAFFDRREAFGRELGRRHAAFCGVIRPDDHPLRPPEYRPLDGFWTARGYARLPKAVARFSWKDVDQAQATEKDLQFWIKNL